MVTEPAHGSRRRYQRGCRCSPCTAAARDYLRDYRARRRKGWRAKRVDHDAVRAAVVSALTRCPHLPRWYLLAKVAHLGVSHRSIDRCLRALVADGLVIREERGRYTMTTRSDRTG